MNPGDAMKLIEFYAGIRKEILELISGLANSNGYISWDNTTPNYVTRSRLESHRSKYIDIAKQFGVYVVTRYSSCSNLKHEGYPTEDRYGLGIIYRDTRFIWGSDQLYQGYRYSTCPCNSGNRPHQNTVIDDVIFAIGANIETCRRIASILDDLSEAISAADCKKPRSGIRENLLRLVLRLNDALLPQLMDEYIEGLLARDA
jgi:hypothetical protein